MPRLSRRMQLRYGDFDVQGHVNNSVLLQIVESARTELWAQAGISRNPGQVIRKQEIEYLRPIGVDNSEVTVEHSCSRIGNSSYVLTFRVLIGAGVLAGHGSVVLVAVDDDGRPEPILGVLRTLLESLADADGESRAGHPGAAVT